MDIFDKYSKRIGESLNSNAKAQIEKNIRLMEINFKTSPSFYVVDIDGDEVDTIITKTKNFEVKTIHFRHNYNPQVGSVIDFKDQYYILTEKDSDEVYTFAKMQECNNTISLISGEDEKVYVGDDIRGAPIYEYRPQYKNEPCIVDDKYASTNENTQVPLPEGKLTVSLKNQVSPTLEVNKEFKMYGKTYKIAELSFTNVQDGVGVLRVHAERRDNKDE